MFSAYRTACLEEALLLQENENSKMKKEISFFQKIRQNFNLDGISPIYFWKSEWDHNFLGAASSGFIFYRLIFAFYFLCTLILNFYCSDQDINLWFIYATHWSYLIQTIYAITATWVVFSSKWTRTHQSAQEMLPLAEKLNWVLYNVVSMIPIGVTIIYWIFIYEQKHKSKCAVVSNFTVHATNSVMALLDTCIVAIPIHATHFVFGFAVMLFYMFFAIFYEIGGGVYEIGRTAIYDMINWKDTPGNAALVSTALLLVFIIFYFVFGWGLTSLRQYISNKLIHKEYYSL